LSLYYYFYFKYNVHPRAYDHRSQNSIPFIVDEIKEKLHEVGLKDKLLSLSGSKEFLRKIWRFLFFRDFYIMLVWLVGLKTI
jgi:hypothetical protein